MFEFLMHRRDYESMKRLYNWFHKHYGNIEEQLGERVDEILDSTVRLLPDLNQKTALEYACGSGMLSLMTAKLFKSVDASDASEGMLGRAKMRASQAGLSITFREGNILEIDEAENSYDYVFVSFALHLFPLEKQVEILKKLLNISREALIIIDHGKKWKMSVAIVEWIEGGYYDKFIKTDFSKIADRIGAKKFEEKQFLFKDFMSCSYMAFHKNTFLSTGSHQKL
jgi:ubiquinone/menaquinone biosynthesis C-methylase UbiE